MSTKFFCRRAEDRSPLLDLHDDETTGAYLAIALYDNAMIDNGTCMHDHIIQYLHSSHTSDMSVYSVEIAHTGIMTHYRIGLYHIVTSYTTVGTKCRKCTYYVACTYLHITSDTGCMMNYIYELRTPCQQTFYTRTSCLSTYREGIHLIRQRLTIFNSRDYRRIILKTVKSENIVVNKAFYFKLRAIPYALTSHIINRTAHTSGAYDYQLLHLQFSVIKYIIHIIIIIQPLCEKILTIVLLVSWRQRLKVINTIEILLK